jgi:hypothetical protein
MNKIGRLIVRSEEVRNAEDTYLTLQYNTRPWIKARRPRNHPLHCIAEKAGEVQYRIREYWMIYRDPNFLAVIWFGSSPTPFPLFLSASVSLSQYSCVSPIDLYTVRKGLGTKGYDCEKAWPSIIVQSSLYKRIQKEKRLKREINNSLYEKRQTTMNILNLISDSIVKFWKVKMCNIKTGNSLKPSLC